MFNRRRSNRVRDYASGRNEDRGDAIAPPLPVATPLPPYLEGVGHVHEPPPNEEELRRLNSFTNAIRLLGYEVIQQSATLIRSLNNVIRVWQYTLA